MRHSNEDMIIPIRGRIARSALQCAVFGAALVLTAWSAIVVKEATVTTPLAEVRRAPTGAPVVTPAVYRELAAAMTPEAPDMLAAERETPVAETVRWFDGRRVRPVRTVWMRVTAYSPDARSCGKWADGQTATLHSVWTNAMRLVAADTRVLPFGSLVSVPGYADNEVVPVLDRGGAIKGMRLDVLMPTHEIARRWGVRDIPVTVWEYEDEIDE